MSHPTPWEFHPVHHPSYIDFFEQVLAETTDPVEIEKKYEKQFAEDEWYRHLYRTSYAYHGVHPFYMWYWGAHALQHLGRRDHRRRRRRRRCGGSASSRRRRCRTPSRWPTDVVGRDPSITHLHNPPILMADVHADGGRHRRRRSRCVAAGCRSRTAAPTRARRASSRRAGGADASAPTTTPTGPAAARPASARRAARRGRRCGRRSRRSADPSAAGVDRLDRRSTGPAIFAANHHSHLDTPLLLTSIPEPWRHSSFVGGGRRLLLRQPRDRGRCRRSCIGAIPIERTKVTRRSADQAAELIDDGWSLLIFPEGGRTPDGWGQPFRGGAAYLALRCGVPVVPVHLEGTGRILPKGTQAARARRAPGSPSARRCGPAEGEDSRALRRPHRGRGGRPGRRGADRLVVGPARGPHAGADAAADRPRRRRVAPGLGPRRPRPVSARGAGGAGPTCRRAHRRHPADVAPSGGSGGPRTRPCTTRVRPGPPSTPRRPPRRAPAPPSTSPRPRAPGLASCGCRRAAPPPASSCRPATPPQRSSTASQSGTAERDRGGRLAVAGGRGGADVAAAARDHLGHRHLGFGTSVRADDGDQPGDHDRGRGGEGDPARPAPSPVRRPGIDGRAAHRRQALWRGRCRRRRGARLRPADRRRRVPERPPPPPGRRTPPGARRVARPAAPRRRRPPATPPRPGTGRSARGAPARPPAPRP